MVSSFPRLIVVPAVCFLAADKHEIDGVRKEKERLTAASISCLPFQLRPLTARKELGNLSTSNGLSGGYAGTLAEIDPSTNSPNLWDGSIGWKHLLDDNERLNETINQALITKDVVSFNSAQD